VRSSHRRSLIEQVFDRQPSGVAAAGVGSVPMSTDAVTRYRCTSCGNLTRFDVTSTRRTRAFHHYTVGGELRIEDETVLAEELESVECRWCGPSGIVVEIDAATAAGLDEPDPSSGASVGEG
jgi:hypothetical protein